MIADFLLPPPRRFEGGGGPSPGWSAAATEAEVRTFAEERCLKLGKVAQPLRAALTGRGVCARRLRCARGARTRGKPLGRREGCRAIKGDAGGSFALRHFATQHWPVRLSLARGRHKCDSYIADASGRSSRARFLDSDDMSFPEGPRLKVLGDDEFRPQNWTSVWKPYGILVHSGSSWAGCHRLSATFTGDTGAFTYDPGGFTSRSAIGITFIDGDNGILLSSPDTRPRQGSPSTWVDFLDDLLPCCLLFLET